MKYQRSVNLWNQGESGRGIQALRAELVPSAGTHDLQSIAAVDSVFKDIIIDLLHSTYQIYHQHRDRWPWRTDLTM